MRCSLGGIFAGRSKVSSGRDAGLRSDLRVRPLVGRRQAEELAAHEGPRGGGEAGRGLVVLPHPHPFVAVVVEQDAAGDGAAVVARGVEEVAVEEVGRAGLAGQGDSAGHLLGNAKGGIGMSSGCR